MCMYTHAYIFMQPKVIEKNEAMYLKVQKSYMGGFEEREGK